MGNSSPIQEGPHLPSPLPPPPLPIIVPAVRMQTELLLRTFPLFPHFERRKKKIELPLSKLASYHHRIFLLFSGHKRIPFYCTGSRSERMRNLENSGRPPLNLNVIWNQLSSGKKQKLINFVVGFLGFVFKLLSSTQL